ncbi:lipoprotein A-like [Colias croceus]|uniref:lipoprotein A-like n=1 Tax=Colias crocea TaxID=72248 RepID=UPI001E27F1FA|nr:lipoprotein A-like [Colias croceus]
MKSKNLNLPRKTTEKEQTNKTYDFVKYYNTSDGDSVNIKENLNKSDPNDHVKKPIKRRQNPNKMKTKGGIVNMSKIDIDGTNLSAESGNRSPLNSKATSTPNVSKNKNPCVKSILKGTSAYDSVDTSNVPSIKPKKRNKSVSLMLEDNEVIIKKTKSNDSLMAKNQDTVKTNLKKSKPKSKLIVKEDKENNNLKENNTDNQKEITRNKRKQPGKKIKKIPVKSDQEMGGGDNTSIVDMSTKATEEKIIVNTMNEKATEIKKKRRKRGKNLKPTADSEIESTEDNVLLDKQKLKKTKKNKHTVEGSESEEPAKKTKKKNKPEVIAKGIENLNIGDNAHTLTNMLDEMSVDKKKKKKIKKNPKILASTELKPELNTDEVKKSKKRKNKKKNRNLNAAVLVQNLPFSIILNYRQLLKEHFSKFGNVQNIGIADLKCDGEDPKPIFTTRIFFTTPKEALAAVAEDKTVFENNIIRIKKYVAPAERRATWVNTMRYRKPGEKDQTKPEPEKMAPEVDSDSD